MILNTLVCDACGAVGVEIAGRPRSSLIRAEAREDGWAVREFRGKRFDVCGSCVLRPDRRLDQSVWRRLLERRRAS